jgi:hypothetical protein
MSYIYLWLGARRFIECCCGQIRSLRRKQVRPVCILQCMTKLRADANCVQVCVGHTELSGKLEHFIIYCILRLSNACGVSQQEWSLMHFNI